MEDHHHHQQQQYGVADLRQLLIDSTSTHFPFLPTQPTADLTPTHHQQHYENEMMMFGGHVIGIGIMPHIHTISTGFHNHEFAASDSAPTVAAINTAATPITTTSASTPPLSGLEGETSLGGDVSIGRWSRQETLTLLEIRSRLDSKFKQANQKGPFWDEVSRILSEEYGYQRSGKKCREKFENLYKYYKKTKEGKSGRQDGKHYRFFRQFEALCGENNINNPISSPIPETNFVCTTSTSSLPFPITALSHSHSQTKQEIFQSGHFNRCVSLSLTNSTDDEYQLYTSSSDGNDFRNGAPMLMQNGSMEKKRKRRSSSGSSWKSIKDFIDSQMRKLIEKQDACLERLRKTMQQKEKERVLREEEWRKQEAASFDREHKFWAKERALIEARDAALMEALKKLMGSKETKGATSPGHDDILMAAHEIQSHNEDGSEILNSTVIRSGADQSWPESEITRLFQLRDEMESRFRQSVELYNSEDVLWEEIAAKMGCFGYERSALMCKQKWESIIIYSRNTSIKDCNKKRKDNSRSSCYLENNDHSQSLSLYNYNQGSAFCAGGSPQVQPNDGSSLSYSNAGNAVADSCFRFLMGEGQNLWENYGLNLN
ncbi:Trihelix transcription factor PTL [Quillaja saponaria]|uniref:Trihelix transcription factor PTL n=1 Tax=Quillaja saponaria TaxID=32244 RepID=A0AAD7Q752_QUISA|nr:Trihelix transcription factor PTL [Quillaja saponaria]